MQARKHSQNKFYRPELDAVRFVAFVFVFLQHDIPSGDRPIVQGILKSYAPLYISLHGVFQFGLSLFFTLSAFLICELLLRERDVTGTIGVKEFYIRRILRIWPLYYLALAIGLGYALLSGGDRTAIAGLGWFALFMGSWYTTAHSFISSNPMFPLWSISVEEQFYLFVPWLAKYFHRRSLFVFCAVLILNANGWLFYLGNGIPNDHRIWANSFVQFECFAAGILLSLFLKSRVPALTTWQRCLLLACGSISWITASIGLTPPGGAAPSRWALMGSYALVSAGSVLLIVASLGISPKLLPRWTIYSGRISYGLYVYHVLAIYLVSSFFGRSSFARSMTLEVFWVGLITMTSIGLNFLLAALSYRYFETPFLKLKQRHSVIESQPIANGH